MTTVGALADAVENASSGWDRRLAMAQLECAIADLWSAERGDDWGPWQQRSLRMSLAEAVAGVDRGQRVEISAPEGLRYYGLWPQGYEVAARAWRAQNREGPVWVLGLRTMGSLLAPVVAAALAEMGGEVRCLTLRPRGQPDDRRIEATPRLQAAAAQWPGWWLIADEGPGLSGSSFGGTVAWLAGLGVAERRIVLLASGSPAPETLGSGYAAAGWRRWTILKAAAMPAPTDGVDLSGGQWRRALANGQAIPAWGEHERQKYLVDDGRTLVKFAGFAGYGQVTRERARRLAAAGWGPPLEGDGGGNGVWVRYRRLAARPLRELPERGWCEFAGRYLAWVAAEYRMGDNEAPSEALREMVAINSQRLLGYEPNDEAPVGPRVRLDGRMLAEEWGRWRGGWVKFDGTDHGDDPFFPGPADIAWDVAAVGVEFGARAGEAVAAEYRRRSGETERGLAPRLKWHRRAYSLFRAAYCGLAATRVEGGDAALFLAASRRYRRTASGCR